MGSQQNKDLWIPYCPNDIPLEYPKNKQHGHFASPISFVLAKKMRKNPREIADNFAIFLRQKARLSHHNKNTTFFSEIVSLNGYLNLKLSLTFFAHQVNQALANPTNFGKRSCDSNKHKILLEYVSANPTGPLHIGHARGAIFGSVFQRIGKYLGDEIISEYYVNDAGSQINMLARSIYNAATKILHLTQQDGDVYKGEYIESVAQEAISYFQEDFFKNNFDDIQEDLGIFGKERMLQVIQYNLESAHIIFENFVSEKEIYSRWNETLCELEKHNALEHKDNAIWLKSSLKGDEKDRVLVRENGEPTYMAGDIIYHRDKFQRDFDSYINIWGADHHGYVARIKASVEFLGFDSNRLEVLLAQMVSLLKGGQPYKMSKRAGNFILMQDVIDDIGADSLKFIFLSKSLDTHLEFDIEDLNKQDSSNPVFYINYANARIHTLLEKTTLSKEHIHHASFEDLNQWNETLEQNNNLNQLQDELMNLILCALSLHHILEQAYQERAIQKLCEYLKNLAKQFHAFYNTHRILNTIYEAQILKALELVSLSFTIGFALLGIEIKTKM
ncbi:arginine--tRNA ligase [Helicobacter didelphidarum]|nr:arginine--tRNA ligase [Helicobacter didelphidarum]